MAESRISYLNRNYDDYRNAILDITKKYYPEIYDNFSDASIGSWFIDIFSDIADNLSYHIDRVYQETSIDSASEGQSLLDIARNQGIKVPGKKAAIVEVELSFVLPLDGSQTDGDIAVADEHYAPYVKKGTLFSTGLVTFELANDVDFKQQFDENGISNRQMYPVKDSNGKITGYLYKKLAIAKAGQSKIYKKIISKSDIEPFMTVLLQDNSILGVESIIVKDGKTLNTDPATSEFSVDLESFTDKDGKTVQRFFEVDNLAQQYRFGYETEYDSEKKQYNPKWENETSKYFTDKDGKTVEISEEVVTRKVVRGKWTRLKNKFTTEFTNNGSLKIMFGSGIKNKYGTIPTDAKEFTQYMMTRMEANDYMGVLPESDTTMYILYRVGGGEQSNIAKNTLTNIISYNMTIDGNCNDDNNSQKMSGVRNSFMVTNTTPSYGGKDSPSTEELRQYIKYAGAAQNRCVTTKDYYAKLIELPPMYGTPFRCGVIEENNKIVIYTLGLDSEGHLTSKLAEVVANNIKEYLSNYRMINDFVEIRSGKIFNIAFEVDVFVDKTYDKSEVVKRLIDLIEDYMDVRHHNMGEDIFLGDLEKEISKLDGITNLIELRCYNKVGSSQGYSDDEVSQELVDINDCNYSEYNESDSNYDNRIDLKASDKVLISESNSLFEVKYPSTDIRINVKTR